MIQPKDKALLVDLLKFLFDAEGYCYNDQSSATETCYMLRRLGIGCTVVYNGFKTYTVKIN